MIEKVNPSHPDKIADRIAGAIVDLAYTMDKRPKVAVEVLIGHGLCTIIIESDVLAELETADQVAGEIYAIVDRIAGEGFEIDIRTRPQDSHLSDNQRKEIRCGDNGIFLGMPLTPEEEKLSAIVRDIYQDHPHDGKCILSDDELIVCQSNVDSRDTGCDFGRSAFLDELTVTAEVRGIREIRCNPLGDWTGGTDVDTGATNRKLGSDMGHSVTGGGLHGKDLSKADVSANIFVFEMAQTSGRPVSAYCAIGDKDITLLLGDEEPQKVPFAGVVRFAELYIERIGGFEKLAEWGLF